MNSEKLLDVLLKLTPENANALMARLTREAREPAEPVKLVTSVKVDQIAEYFRLHPPRSHRKPVPDKIVRDLHERWIYLENNQPLRDFAHGFGVSTMFVRKIILGEGSYGRIRRELESLYLKPDSTVIDIRSRRPENRIRPNSTTVDILPDTAEPFTTKFQI